MIPLIAVALASQQPISVDGNLVNSRNLLVKVAGPAKELLRKQLGLTVKKEFKEIGYVLVEAPAGELQLTRNKVRMVSGVQAVQFDRVAKVAYEPNDPLFPNQWNLPAMNVPDAWTLSLGNTPTTVAVIDTGVDYSHEDLANNVWTNTAEIPGNDIDDDNNGYIDDVHGYDFAYGDSEPNDNYGHGTACASIVAATQDNALGITGVAPMARIMCVKAALDSGYFYDSATVPAYIYAANNGAKIFSCSFYADSVSQAEHEAIRYAVGKGVLPIVAAGNEYSVIPFYPGAYEESIGVAALKNTGGGVAKSGFSNYGSWVDVAAPGSGIYVAGSGGGYWSGSGTSFACPNTAGVAALLWSTKPSAAASEIRAAIEDTATEYSEAPYGEISNFGNVNALAALEAIMGDPAPRRTAAFRYMTPLGSRDPSSKARVLSRIFGRGFEKDARVVVKKGNRHLHVRDRGRTFVDFYNVDGPDPVTLWVDGNLVATIPQPQVNDYVYPLIEASSPHAVVTGGFAQANGIDGTTLDCTTRGDNYLRMESTFARVIPADTMTLNITRNYTGTIGGSETETVYLYDWTSASYPYGNWIAVNNEFLPTTMTTTHIPITDASRFVDYEGYVYMLVMTSGNDPSVTGHYDQINLGY